MGEPRRLTKRQTVGEESRKRMIRERRQKCEIAGGDIFPHPSCDFKNTFHVFQV